MIHRTNSIIYNYSGQIELKRMSENYRLTKRNLGDMGEETMDEGLKLNGQKLKIHQYYLPHLS